MFFRRLWIAPCLHWISSFHWKCVSFSRAYNSTSHLPAIHTPNAAEIEIHIYKHLRIWLDSSLTFKQHVEQLAQKLRLKLRSYIRIKHVCVLQRWKMTVQSPIISVLDNEAILYFHAARSALKQLDVVYHCALCLNHRGLLSYIWLGTHPYQQRGECYAI